MSTHLLRAEQAPVFALRYLIAALALHGLAGAALWATRPQQQPADAPPALSFRILQTAPRPPAPQPVVPSPPAAQGLPKSQPPRPSAPLLRSTLPAEAEVAAQPAVETPPQPPTAAEAPAPPQRPAVAAPAAAHADTAPRFDADYLDNPAPAYPVLARRMGEEGTVVLRVFVEPSGRPGQIQIHSGSGSVRLDQAAQESVARWQFVPAQRAGEAIGAWVLVPIQFSLRS